MNSDIEAIQDRIENQFDLGAKTLFWEDEAGEYSEVVESLDIAPAVLVNVTKRELSSKRTILRARPAERVVVYRSGGTPRPEDDFLYDLKLAAVPFSCRMEGVWASECGVSPMLVDALSAHARFFNSKERRERLAASGLPKGTEGELKVAMLGCCAKSASESRRDVVRDVVRRLLVEHARDQETTLRLIEESCLSQCLWNEIDRVLGYASASPTIEDLAFCMLQTRCVSVMPDSFAPLSSDAIRILDGMASNAQTREDFDNLVEKYHEPIAAMVDPADRTAESLLEQDALPEFDAWILEDARSKVEIGALRSADAEKTIQRRKHTLWYARFAGHYECISAAAALLEGIDSYRSASVSATDAKSLFVAYCKDWSAIDGAYRRFVAAYHAIPGGRFKKSLQVLYGKAVDSYDKFLMDLTDRWQLHLFDEGPYPPASIPSQDDFFHERILKEFPRAEGGKRVGLIVSDALRYELGAELARRLGNGELLRRKRVEVKCDGMACMLPSYTQLGMAALLPAGGMEIDPETDNVMKGGQPTNGIANRQEAIRAAVPDAAVLQAASVLESGLPSIQDAPLVVVYHNVVDKRGDSRDTEGEVFAACEEAIGQIARIANELLAAGCGKVLVTADHGFVYQDRPVAEYDYAVVKGLDDLAASGSQSVSHSRRYAVGSMLPESDMLIMYSAADLSLEGDYKIAMPRGIARLRLRGSGARYMHGGASLQENVIPVVTITQTKRPESATQTGVQGFLTGRPVITGSVVTLDVYQTRACSSTITPLTVKVGLYAPDDAKRILSASEPVLELSSTSETSEDRKIRVSLPVTNDVDEYSSAVLRISTRIGKTSQYQTEWETKLSISRVFGNDFDF